ncbi:IS4 family transposase [Salmonella enterica]|uniref:IS4 family transposase n=3 Tax=Salmonella enterica TaxID=28901 RepID=A0A2X4T2N1_SALER|nr:IS4 family transposase [Salmonella enterica subsp. arizonae serovar 62:z36:-]EAQ1568354.1 IS4 family transposase [Salmonella enterica]ECG1413075.1 IS4 family transposase [Salmonella enterica subsp. arizonae str. CFSAN000560]EDH0570698.1 IS4 family transposase [Salmonella enterica subsp. arizonae]EDW8122454.1 IS4 family transposase [Salmonella enterica subsp. salamae]EEJ5250615.1 IS4 family transposase [Salmonella enterica subsp. enterica serovar Waycross]EGE4652080.1 IS4 family transposase
MPARQVCQNFFRDALAPLHKYRQNALLDATIALINGASLTLTSIGRYLPGTAQVKNKIKRVDRLRGNESLHRNIPLIFRNIIAMLTSQLSLCVIAVDWSGYPSQEHHVLRASLICDGCSIPLLRWIVPSEKQQNAKVQQAFLNTLAEAVNPEARVIIVTDAGFQNAWFRHIESLGWDFIGRIRGNIQMRLEAKGEYWFRRQELQASSKPEYLGPGMLARSEYARCDGHFYLHKKEPKGRKNKRSRCGIARPSQLKDASPAAKEPWLIFNSTDDFKPRVIMKLYSRRMQIEQNFRDEKSERFGFGLRASYSRSAGRVLALSLLATLSTIVLWLVGYHAENKGLHLRYQANSVRIWRVITYLTLAENVLRQSPLILKRTVLRTVLNHLARTYQNMVLVY